MGLCHFKGRRNRKHGKRKQRMIYMHQIEEDQAVQGESGSFRNKYMKNLHELRRDRKLI